MPTQTNDRPQTADLEHQRQLAVLTADAIFRNADSGDWRHLETLARSLLRTVAAAISIEARRGRS